MADTQFHGLGDAATPADWSVAPSLEVTLKAAQATYDASGAAGAIVPALEIISDAGLPVGVYVATTSVAAGDTAEVSFAPFLEGATAGGTSSGIQFDTENSGDWFSLETTTDDPSDIPIGIRLNATGVAGGMLLETAFQPLQITGGGDLNHGGVQILSNGNGLTILYDSPSATPLQIDTFQRQEVDICSGNSQSGNVNICGDPTFVGNSLGFFQSGGVGQQTLPAAPTGAQIRAVLVAFGLVAP